MPGFYETVSDTFLPANHGNNFITDFSPAINARSFCNYIVKNFTYMDGTELTSSNKTQLYNFLIEDISSPAQSITINTAMKLLYKLRFHMAGTTDSITINGNNLSALSYNTAKQLFDKYMPADSGFRSSFCRLNQIYDNSGDLNDYNYMTFEFYFPMPTSSSYSLSGTLKGGGGGGTGGVSGDNGKVNVTTTAGVGYKGSNTVLEYTYNGNTTTITATGGTAAGSNSYYHEGNAPYNRDGSTGNPGNTQSVSLTINAKSVLKITPGNGGSGGGGCATKKNSGGSWSANSATSTAGGDGKAYNDWSGEDWTYGCGGGAGGGSGTTPGTSGKSGPSGNPTSGQYGSNGVGGRGGWGDYAQTSQPITIGAGGVGGKSAVQDDVVCNANGGNGGNCGSLYLSGDGGSAASVLVIVKQINN
jgi:hypothetical protein